MNNEKKYYRFIFVLEDIDITDDAIVDKIYESGCNDASIESREQIVYLDFDRESETVQAAVSSAMENVSRTGIKVLRVEPGDAVTASEIAYRLNKSREYVRLLISGKRGKGNFPAPISGIDRPTQIFSWAEVAKWCYRQEIIKDKAIIEIAGCILKTNRALENHLSKILKKPKKIRSGSTEQTKPTYVFVAKSK